MGPWSPEWKLKKLQELQDQWESCQRCGLHETRRSVVFGEGNPDADILFVGEAPGENEDKTGRPFVGQAGDILWGMWEVLGQDRDDVFITNVVACRPPKNRDPAGAEKAECLPRLHEIIYLIDPLLIVAIGKYALNALCGGKSWSIEKMHGVLFSSPHPSARIKGESNGVEIPGRVLPLKGDDKLVYPLDYDVVGIYHPAYIARNDSYNKKTQSFEPGGLADETLEDLRVILARVAELHDEYDVIRKHIERM